MMGRLPDSPREVRWAVTLFLALLGVADVFGGLEVRNFASFTPAGTAATVAPEKEEPMMSCPVCGTMEMEHPVDLGSLDHPHHVINRELLVQDTHVHIPVYAMAAAFLTFIICGLRFSSRTRMILITLAFAAPLLDFVGLWGAHLVPQAGTFFGALAVGGGLTMGLVYFAVLVPTLIQCWGRRAA
jgi:hypothetical protein